MKKTWTVLISLALCMGLLAGCAAGKSPASGNGASGAGGNRGDASKDKKYTVTATAPQGWQAGAGSGILLRYKKDSGDFWVKQGFSGGSVESDIEFYKERENSGGYDIAWEDVQDETVNGMDAKYLKYTVDTGSLKMRYDVYFVGQDAALFTVICMTSPDSDYGDVEPGYKALLDSLKITGE